MLACLDLIDDFFISDANDVLRIPTVIQISDRRGHNIFLYTLFYRLYVNKKG